MDGAEGSSSVPCTLKLGPRFAFPQLRYHGWGLPLITQHQSSEMRAQYTRWPGLDQSATFYVGPQPLGGLHLGGPYQVAGRTPRAQWDRAGSARGAGSKGLWSWGPD